MSFLVPMRTRANLLFRLRALFGLGPRAEIVAFLHTCVGARSSEIARATWYSHTQVQEALSGLARAEVVKKIQRGSQTFYRLERQRFGIFETSETEISYWFDWPRVFSALRELSVFLANVQSEGLSEYLLRSDILGLSQRLSDSLDLAGFHNPFDMGTSLSNAGEVFENAVRKLLDRLCEPQ